MRDLYKFMPAYRSTMTKSSAIIAGSKYTQSQLPKFTEAKSIYIPENGIDPIRFQKQRSHQATLPLRAAFVGRLVPYKCADVLIRAAAEYFTTVRIGADEVAMDLGGVIQLIVNINAVATGTDDITVSEGIIIKRHQGTANCIIS